MLGIFKKKEPPTSEQIKQAREKWLNEMLVKSAKLQALIKVKNTGWEEFCGLLDDYIDKAMKRKAITALDRATDADIYQLKLLDHEIYFLNFIKRIPEQFIGKIEAEIEKEKEKEE